MVGDPEAGGLRAGSTDPGLRSFFKFHILKSIKVSDSSIVRHGGAREGAGRPRKVESSDKIKVASDYRDSRARHEAAKAAIAELDAATLAREYVSRATFAKASETIVRHFASTMQRHVDHMCRSLQLTPDADAMLRTRVDDALATLKRGMENLSQSSVST